MIAGVPKGILLCLKLDEEVAVVVVSVLAPLTPPCSIERHQRAILKLVLDKADH